SAGSVPIALDEALAEGRLRPGQLAVLSGFGAGLAWGTAVMRWGAPRGIRSPVAVSAMLPKSPLGDGATTVSFDARRRRSWSVGNSRYRFRTNSRQSHQQARRQTSSSQTVRYAPIDSKYSHIRA